MWLRNPLSDVLSSRAKVDALRVLALSSIPLNGREISRRAGTEPGYTSKILKELAASGVVARTDQGRAITYELLAGESELVALVRELFTAEQRRHNRIVADLSEQLGDAVSITLFGSEARGEPVPGSDTDILIVAAQKTEELEDRVREACLSVAERYSLALSWHVADVEELRRWDESGLGLWQDILRDGVTLSGQPVGRLRQRWQDGRIT